MTSEALTLLIRDELAHLHLAAEHLVVVLSDSEQWHASLRVHGREFELGSAFHGGFFCRQKTPRGMVSFVPADLAPLFGGHGLLVRSGVQLIAAGMNDPEAAATGPAVI